MSCRRARNLVAAVVRSWCPHPSWSPSNGERSSIFRVLVSACVRAEDADPTAVAVVASVLLMFVLKILSIFVLVLLVFACGERWAQFRSVYTVQGCTINTAVCLVTSM